mmetsp:Transcript_19495/g.54809  ORF Transcript_19495/g.54809 Transcript_19495/m.54809 type:complete len:103 (+) Transcript_19495:259-567(+)
MATIGADATGRSPPTGPLLNAEARDRGRTGWLPPASCDCELCEARDALWVGGASSWEGVSPQRSVGKAGPSGCEDWEASCVLCDAGGAGGARFVLVRKARVH